jgi:tetratricopeptide (TPR) repeat protein
MTAPAARENLHDVLMCAAPIQERYQRPRTAPAILDFDDKRYDDALANLRRALEIEPNHVEALYYTGVVQMARDRPEEAIPVSETVKDETCPS